MSIGALNDGRKSLTRYYLNKFHDAYRQQAIDLCHRTRTCEMMLAEGVELQVYYNHTSCSNNGRFIISLSFDIILYCHFIHYSLLWLS